MEKDNFGIISKLIMAVLVAFFIQMFIVAILGTFLDNAELKELLGGSSTLPVFYPTVIVCVCYVLFKHFKRLLLK